MHGVGEDEAGEDRDLDRAPAGGGLGGRACDRPAQPRSEAARPDDYVFEGYELGDALEAANNALSDDLQISAGDGVSENVERFREEELLKPLERWFFGRS